MLNLLIISGLLVGCADTSSDVDSFSVEPSEATGNLQVPVAYEFSVKVTDGTEGHIDVVPYSYTDNGITAGKPVSSGAIVDGVASIGLPANAPKRDLARLQAGQVTYALILRGEEGNILGIAKPRVVFNRYATMEHPVGWNLGFDLNEETERYMSIHSNVEIDANLTGSESISFQVTPEIEGGEQQHIAVLTMTDRIYGFWDSKLAPGLEISIDAAPPETAYSFESGGIDIHQSVGIAYTDENQDGAFNLEEPIAGMFCQDYAPINITYVDSIFEPEQALNLEMMELKTGWQVTQQTSEGAVALPDTAAANLHVQDTCTLSR